MTNEFREIGESSAWPGATLWLCDNHGSLVKRDRLYWASNDVRTDLIGLVSNKQLVQPTMGPFRSKQEAMRAYIALRMTST